MHKVMNFRFMTIDYMDVKTSFYWVCGEVEYDLVYDQDGDLYGVVVDNLEQDIIDDLEEGFPNCEYDFPCTLGEYCGDLRNLKVFEIKEIIEGKNKLVFYFNSKEDENNADYANDQRFMLDSSELIENLIEGEGTYESSLDLNLLRKDIANLNKYDNINMRHYTTCCSRIAVKE